MSKNIDWAYVESLSYSYLTFEAEEWGRSYPVTEALPALLRLCSHKEALVRDGAVAGLGHLKERGVWTEAMAQRLRELASKDPSAGVRSSADEVLG